MTSPPELWGWTPKAMDYPDPRWLAVKDEKCPAAIHSNAVASALVVDNLVNQRIEYQLDVADYWFLPDDTWKHGMGDCEDFAILKRSILLESGWSDDMIWFLLVTDVLARCDHAVLLVYDDCWRILDCRKGLAGGALPVEQVSDFTPRRAMQGERQWRFERRRAAVG